MQVSFKLVDLLLAPNHGHALCFYTSCTTLYIVPNVFPAYCF